MKLHLANAIVEKISSRADRTFSVHLGLPELPPEEALELFQCLQTEIAEVHLDLDADTKSPSQRLRNTLFVYYKQSKGSADGFDQWYVAEMNRIKQSYIEKLN